MSLTHGVSGGPGHDRSSGEASSSHAMAELDARRDSFGWGLAGNLDVAVCRVEWLYHNGAFEACTPPSSPSLVHPGLRTCIVCLLRTALGAGHSMTRPWAWMISANRQIISMPLKAELHLACCRMLVIWIGNTHSHVMAALSHACAGLLQGIISGHGPRSLCFGGHACAPGCCCGAG